MKSHYKSNFCSSKGNSVKMKGKPLGKEFAEEYLQIFGKASKINIKAYNLRKRRKRGRMQ